MRLGSIRSVLLCTVALFAASAAPASAIVGGQDASPGEYPSVAEVTFGPFLCTGTLIAPNYVLSAGHCGSVTGAAVSTPIAWPAAAINVRIGGTTQNDGEVVPVKRVRVHPNYLLGWGYDISLLELQRNSTKTPTPVAGPAERSIWEPADMQTIVGWGATEEGGDLPDVLQEANVPVTTDAYCADAYDSDFDAKTMVCAGYPEGKVDSCQGDSGGPMFAPSVETGKLEVTGATSFGNGCAREGYPGVYARVADSLLRGWIQSVVPAGVS